MKLANVFGSLFVAALFIGSGCASQQQASEPIKIGFISPLTGDASSVGVPTRQAAELAVEEVNAAGGVNGRKLELIVEDGKCSPKDATSAASKLIDADHVVAIVGGLCSSETSAFIPIAMQKKVIVFSHGSSAPSLSKAGKYFFRTYPSDAYAGKAEAEYAYNVLGSRTAAIVFHISDYGNGLKDTFTARFQELGGKIVVTEGAPQEARDYRAAVTKIKAAGVDLVYIPTYPDGAAVLVKQLQEQKVTAKILGSDALTDSKFQASVKGGDVRYGELITLAPTESFKKGLLAKTGGTEVTLATQQAYDNVKILAQVFTAVGTDPDKVEQAMRTLKYSGVSGEITFDANGDLNSPVSYAFKIIKNGKAELAK